MASLAILQAFLNLLQQTFLLLHNNHFKEITMFDQFQQFTDIAQNFQGAQWGVQIQEQFQQHFQNWFNAETVEPAKSTFSLCS